MLSLSPTPTRHLTLILVFSCILLPLVLATPLPLSLATGSINVSSGAQAEYLAKRQSGDGVIVLPDFPAPVVPPTTGGGNGNSPSQPVVINPVEGERNIPVVLPPSATLNNSAPAPAPTSSQPIPASSGQQSDDENKINNRNGSKDAQPKKGIQPLQIGLIVLGAFGLLLIIAAVVIGAMIRRRRLARKKSMRARLARGPGGYPGTSSFGGYGGYGEEKGYPATAHVPGPLHLSLPGPIIVPGIRSAGVHPYNHRHGSRHSNGSTMSGQGAVEAYAYSTSQETLTLSHAMGVRDDDVRGSIAMRQSLREGLRVHGVPQWTAAQVAVEGSGGQVVKSARAEVYSPIPYHQHQRHPYATARPVPSPSPFLNPKAGQYANSREAELMAGLSSAQKVAHEYSHPHSRSNSQSSQISASTARPYTHTRGDGSLKAGFLMPAPPPRTLASYSSANSSTATLVNAPSNHSNPKLSIVTSLPSHPAPRRRPNPNMIESPESIQGDEGFAGRRPSPTVSVMPHSKLLTPEDPFHADDAASIRGRPPLARSDTSISGSVAMRKGGYGSPTDVVLVGEEGVMNINSQSHTVRLTGSDPTRYKEMSPEQTSRSPIGGPERKMSVKDLIVGAVGLGGGRSA